MPAPRKAVATACRDIFILGRQDAWTRLEELDPRRSGVENRGDLHPGRPPPMTSIERGTSVKAKAPAMGVVNSKPGMGSRRLTPPTQMMILSA